VSGLTLAAAAAAVGGRLVGAADPQRPVRGLTIDSRQVRPGMLFAALVGTRTDGHAHASEALAAGAVAVLASRPVDGAAVLVDDVVAAMAALAAAQRDLLTATRVVAVTGSAGKTTTKDLLADLLGCLGPTVAPPGSYNNDLGTPLTVLAATPATRFLVLELGARAGGDIARLARLARPHVGVVLNVGSAHLGEFGSRAAIARAKSELAVAASDYVVLNLDDPLVAAMAPLAHAEVVTTSARGAAGADVAARDVRLGPDGRAAFQLHAGGQRHPVRLGLLGAHQVANALAAAAVALREGLAPAAVADALAAGARSPGRMALAVSATGVSVLDDAYNANPESMAAALEALVALTAAAATGARSVAVLGEMLELGPDAAAEHRAVGELARRLGVDRLVAVGDGARPLVAGWERGEGRSREAARWVGDADAALRELDGLVGPGDVVLVKASNAARLDRVAAGLLAAGTAR
jgi:UDP-N-acetylmuramoyl-tripeptide--D-alanyl-D-alanine ligase